MLFFFVVELKAVILVIKKTQWELNSVGNRKLDDANLILLTQYEYCTKYGFTIVWEEFLRGSFSEAKTEMLEGKTSED